ncbi:DUF7344 domain-containing protein [Haloarcula onubensis]|uniref:DUF7344 domain-containing protein n=1 Tax=Haloarcula onubensis TaxID=2950539 RepID=A0ABU2FSH6_9EURY|nr:hypothetical protein [Halomicroarcula sp. S3CR25-11]MDS0283705.1 hypothetical protein [Halomicroarcula sp. S3CR25-11]
MATLDESERYRILSDERRRLVLEILAERTTGIGLDDLAQAVTTRQTTGTDVGPGTVDRVRIALHHKHLPMLDESGVLSYESEVRQVEQPRVASERHA